MFQFPGLPPPGLWIRPGARGVWPPRVRPFGDLRVVGRVPLAAAYRSLPRPSSASCAKASTVRPFHLRFYMLVRFFDGLGIKLHTSRSDACLLYVLVSLLLIARRKNSRLCAMRLSGCGMGASPQGRMLLSSEILLQARARNWRAAPKRFKAVKSVCFPGKLCAP